MLYQLTLYSAPGNATERVIWALNFKKIPYQLVDALPLIESGQYLEINPYGYVPTLQVDGQNITESMAIVECLEELFPSPTLLPGTPLQKAKIREICEWVNSTIHPAQNRSILQFFRPELDPLNLKTMRASWLKRNLSKIAPRLWHESDFAVGTQFSLADIFVAVIYNRALNQGVDSSEFESFQAYLRFLYSDSQISESAPFACP
jgi:glutathione S-transferase